jgi:hypothetical protein
MSKKEAEENGIMCGMFRPWTCNRCPAKSEILKYPSMPPVVTPKELPINLSPLPEPCDRVKLGDCSYRGTYTATQMKEYATNEMVKDRATR